MQATTRSVTPVTSTTTSKAERRGPRKRLRRVACLLLAAATAAACLTVPGATATADDDKKEDDAIISLPEGGLELTELLKGLTRVHKTPIVWQEGDKSLQGKKITGAQEFRAPSSKLFELIRALLTFYELAIVPIGPKGYEVYLVMDARQTTGILRLKPVYVELNDANADEYQVQDGLFIATTIKVKNMDNLRDARQALTRMITQQNVGSVTEVPAARSFVVADFAPNVVAIYKLLKEMDVQPAGKKVKVAYIGLAHALAEDVEPILTELFTGRQRISQGVPNQPGGTGDVMDPEPRVMSDVRTNQIIVYAIEDDINEITDLVKHLDTEIFFPQQWVHVIRLKNLDAEETAQVLTSLIEGTSLFGTSGGTFSGGTSRRAGGGTRPSAQPTAPRAAPAGATGQPVENQEKPAVVADKASNSLIIAGSKEQYAELKKIIDEIDRRKDQVLIEASLIELSLSDSFNFAIELAGLDDNGLGAHAGPSAFGGTTFGLTEFADRDGDGIFTDRLPPFISAGGASPTGLVGGIFASGQVPLIYRALNTLKNTRVLQLPSIVTADNDEATISVLDEQATSQSNQTSGGNTSAGFGGFEEAGTTLSISPHIANDKYLLLNINLEVSGFLGEPRVVGNALLPSDKFKRNIVTAVTVPDRHTVVIGGLIGSTQRSTTDQVPFLGEIPILGELFKGTSKSDVRTNLFLFVTPTILSVEDFSDFDSVTCDRKTKADELVGEVDIPFTNFVGCKTGSRACRVVDPATGCVRGSGSTSDRLDKAGFLETTRFGGVDPQRLAAEALARKKALATPAAASPAGR